MQEKTKLLLDSVEHLAQKKFLYRVEIETFVEAAGKHGMTEALGDLTFKAKFISNAYNILNRVGGDTSETAKLAAEFKENLEQSLSLINLLLNHAPTDVRQKFNDRFAVEDPAYLNKLMILLNELSRLKNYSIDKKFSE